MADTNTEVDSGNEKSLDFLENELQKLHKKCLELKISPFEIKKCAKPFFNPVEELRQHRQSSRSSVLKFSVLPVLLILASGLIYNHTSYRYIASFSRQSLLSILPVVDWTKIHAANCFIPNPLDKGTERLLEGEHCQLCGSLTEVSVLLKATSDNVSEEFLQKDRPVIVLNSDTPQRKIDIDDLIKLFLDDDEMSLYTACEFKTNLNITEIKNQRGLLSSIRDGYVSSYYAHWHNCFMEASKRFRQVYYKPDYLPLSVELTTSNWVFLCSDYKEHTPIKLPMLDQFMMLIQLSGELDLIFNPKYPCENNCTQITSTLQEGASLLMTDYFYDVEYVTCTGGTSITVGLLGKMDF